MCVWQTQSLWVPHMCIFNLRLFFISHFLFSDSPIPAFTVLNFLSCLVFFSPLCLKWMLTLFIFLQTCQQFTRGAIWFWGLYVCVWSFFITSSVSSYKFIDFLSLLESLVAVCVFLGMCPFPINHLMCCHTVIHSSPYDLFILCVVTLVFTVSPYSPFYSLWHITMSLFIPDLVYESLFLSWLVQLHRFVNFVLLYKELVWGFVRHFLHCFSILYFMRSHLLDLLPTVALLILVS